MPELRRALASRSATTGPSLVGSSIGSVLGPLVGTYAPVRFIRDSHCAIGGSDTHYTDDLGAFRGDVLVYAAGFGFGQMMLDTADLMTRARVSVEYHPELGESDPYFHRDWVSVAVRPLLRWLRTVRFTRPH